MVDLDSLDRMRLKAMTRIVKAAHAKKIDTFVSVGASAKPINLLFIHLWKELYPKEAMPKMVSLGKLINTITPKFFKDPNSAEILLEQRPILRERMNGRIMLFDDFAKSGNTIVFAKKVFQTLGAKNVTTAVLFTKNRFSYSDPHTGKLRLAKVANVIGTVKSIEKSEELSYYKKRALLGVSLKKARGMNRVKRTRENAKQIRAHLKEIAQGKTRRKRH